ncbi:MAG: HAD-IIIA family hydrolase [Oscillospiraceae bacterium]|nr:HAD-IIIA family hydrolase [Oscillospiraceae bacterium]
MNKAVFIDRDGVINPLVHYSDLGEYESPRRPEEFEIYPYIHTAMKRLKDAGFRLFVISNQPSYAKGKMAWDDVKAIERLLDDMSLTHGKLIERFFYCYHHPQAVIPEYAVVCGCRKPGTLFPEQALLEYSLDAAECFFVGDQDSDILCGQAMGFQTIKISNPHSAHKSGKSKPDHHAKDLLDAASIICRKEEKPKWTNT